MVSVYLQHKRNPNNVEIHLLQGQEIRNYHLLAEVSFLEERPGNKVTPPPVVEKKLDTIRTFTVMECKRISLSAKGLKHAAALYDQNSRLWWEMTKGSFRVQSFRRVLFPGKSVMLYHSIQHSTDFLFFLIEHVHISI